ncbi:hypothetical protein ND861_10265 [Leptospira sp. 2 VSF19]|uniref:Lipoprotein n=1 Tax=Leptospira soteropolitanensis TaxID=2950025 RepID=A0AAW5VF42_9LEPT|nr:hypothetical protein [Leptospira soteropolitanensis]MCW7492406.1 hypothetical protein [Leptospira soteropolitanensis]MCW7500458.1 hypothetical protein [Leptospira soteropolitanensis]MCW7522872.1 hypothetical protein [Leptospira soteropolitanensis]MCW7526731.1 hypothetical protein [Leptospira soteropolitanensis]MCW7530428.1 hypothetical protein [Leptospira soteropolitanensis]
MKRKFVIGFILIFLAYLGCKTSVFGFCTSAEKFVERASIPPCHQTADSKEDATNSCECPIIHEELQSSNSTDFLTWKQVKLPVWKGFTVSKPKFHPDPSKKWLVSSFHNSPIYFPTKTVRLLI